jgi:hypothetical protein
METLETKIVKIGNVEYPLKRTIRAMIDYEKLSGHSVANIKTLEDIAIWFYCTFKAGGSKLTYEEFLDFIDDKPESLKAFTDAMLEKSEKKQVAR